MENLLLTVILLLFVKCDSLSVSGCNFTSVAGCNGENKALPHNSEVCYYKSHGWFATAVCSNGNLTYHCNRTGSTWTYTTPEPPCQPLDTTSTPAPITSGQNISEGSSSHAQTTYIPSSSLPDSTQTTAKSTTITTQMVTNHTQFPQTATEETTSKPADNESTDNITEGGHTSVDKTLASLDSDDKASVVAAAVSVSVVAVILVVLVVAFLLWRKRRQKSTPAAGLHSGNSLTNRSYEDRHRLDRHISLLNIRSNQSVDSGYSEIPLENLRSEETTGNVYQTIDILPDDQIECNGNYGHLEMKTTAFVDNHYSHIPINQANGNVQQDSTYAHTGGATLKPDMENKGQESENTFNILENMPNMTIRGQETDKVHESNTDENESEYNHATARRSDSSGSKADTYSHLNRTWQNRPASSHNDMKPISEGGENQSHNSKGKDSDFGKANGEKNIPDYAKCIKKKKDTENPRQVGSDGYEKASGIAHEYFVLEPDNSTADNETSFRVIEDNCVDNPDDTGDAENPYHQYFTLEKTN